MKTHIELPYGDEAIKNGSGKDWAEWRDLLDAWGAQERPHAEIARYVATELGVPDWWAQGVTVGYERLIGRRAVGQRCDGTFSASASKTIAAESGDVWETVTDAARRTAWLDDGVLEYRTGSKPKSARFDDVTHGIIIAFSIYPTPSGKTSVQVQADNLPSKEFGDAWKAEWKPRLEALAKVFK